ncbi:ABC transporter permease [Alcaligenes faecalis]|jgi:peptide/nickel transport system permease protein|uniref:ABC transporter permease n=1 Tax=Alcaligenes faecalis TaxID=511 RepID=A0ABY7NA95_ALCFA|nr:ABC transporter permease [Alcaligenes faecalis]WBM40144.1 ABC transporter permease [Alcaligenes faecalis]
MIGLIFKRVLATIPVLLIVALVIFVVLRMTHGDAAVLVAGDNATDAQIAEIRHQMGLDQPVPVQFVQWLGSMVQGDFGTSLISSRPVKDLVLDRLGPTVSLTLLTLAYTLAISIPLGVCSAWYRGKSLDRFVMAGSVAGFSVPVFIVAYLLILLFSLELRWLPVQGYKPLSEGLWEHLRHLILPAVSLGTVYIALITRIVRTSVIDTLNEDYIRTARAKGLNERRVLTRHALGNAAVPILTIIGISITMLIGGVVVTESVFNISGLGRLVLDAVLSRDFTVIQSLIVLFSLVYVGVNLLIDISYMLVDPRIDY